MVEGTGTGDLKQGPGHWAETPFPGQGGNFVVSGHRTTYGAPFFKLNDVKVGDEVDLVLPYAVARYTVTRVVIVSPDQVDTVAQLGREQVSLAACHPIYSAKQRIVVQGDLTSFKLVKSQS
jgi:sortase A